MTDVQKNERYAGCTGRRKTPSDFAFFTGTVLISLASINKGKADSLQCDM